MAAIPYRPSRNTRRFMLMPLVDVIFLLLTFFMLSSQVTPYALLPVSAGASADEAAPDPAGADTRPVADLLLTVSQGTVQLNGERVPFADLADRLGLLREAAKGSAIVLPRQVATVQDVVAVLEILRRAKFANVSIRTRAAP